MCCCFTITRSIRNLINKRCVCCIRHSKCNLRRCRLRHPTKCPITRNWRSYKIIIIGCSTTNLIINHYWSRCRYCYRNGIIDFISAYVCCFIDRASHCWWITCTYRDTLTVTEFIPRATNTCRIIITRCCWIIRNYKWRNAYTRRNRCLVTYLSTVIHNRCLIRHTKEYRSCTSPTWRSHNICLQGRCCHIDTNKCHPITKQRHTAIDKLYITWDFI